VCQLRLQRLWIQRLSEGADGLMFGTDSCTRALHYHTLLIRHQSRFTTLRIARCTGSTASGQAARVSAEPNDTQRHQV
jgi:hypothetical protein